MFTKSTFGVLESIDRAKPVLHELERLGHGAGSISVMHLGARGAGPEEDTPQFRLLKAQGPLGQRHASDSVDGLSSTLVGLGMPRFAARRYETLVCEGRVLIAVHADADDSHHLPWLLRKLDVDELGAVYDARVPLRPSEAALDAFFVSAQVQRL